MDVDVEIVEAGDVGGAVGEDDVYWGVGAGAGGRGRGICACGCGGGGGGVRVGGSRVKGGEEEGDGRRVRDVGFEDRDAFKGRHGL